MAPFIGELARRRGEIEGIEASEGSKECCLRAFAPLAELKGFSASVRSLSSGLADISLRLADYRPVTAERQEEILGKMSGFVRRD